MGNVTIGEAIQYGLSLILFGVAIAIGIGVIITIGVTAGTGPTGIAVLVAIILVYAALFGSIYKVIADGVQRGVKAANESQGVFNEPVSSNTNSSGNGGSDEEVTTALMWYQRNSSSAGLTKETRKRFKNSNNIQDLTDSDLKRTIDAIDAYSNEHGVSESLTESRDALIEEWDRRSGQEIK